MKDPNGFGFFDVLPGQRPTGIAAHFGLVPPQEQAASASRAAADHAGLTDEERALIQSDPSLATEYLSKLDSERAKVAAERAVAANVAAVHEAHSKRDLVLAAAERVARGNLK